MKSTALVMLVLFAASCPSIAKPYHGHRHVAHKTHHAKHTNRTAENTNRTAVREAHSGITCEMVRAYVAQVGLAQATAMAQSAGITASEKARARRCLAEKS